MISTENISKIKVSYGGHSVLYGQGGLAGVINIITKQGTVGLDTEVSGEMDDQGNHYSKANVSGGNGKLSFFAGINNSDSDGYPVSKDFMPTSLEDGKIRENSDDRRLSLFGSLACQLNDEVNIGLTLDRSAGEFGTPPITADDKTDPFYKNPKFERTNDFETLSGQVSMSYDPKGILGFRTWAYTNTHTQETARYDDNTYNTITKKNNYYSSDETAVTGATFQTSIHLDAAGEAIVSFSGETDKYTSDFNKVLSNNKPATSYYYDHELDIYSAALEYRLQLFSRLGMVTGYSHHWQHKVSGNNADEGSYMIGTRFDVDDATALRASFARKMRFPSIQQLYDPDSGDPDLKPEQSKNFEVGITRQLFCGMTLNVDVFRNEVDDYIEKDDATNWYENNEAYVFKGFETGLSKTFLETGLIRLGYSYLDARDKSSGTLKDELQYRPKHKYTLDISYTWDSGLTVQADIMHTAGQYFYSDTFRKGKLEDYSIVNLRLEQAFHQGNASVYVGVDNFMDENYEESYGLPQAGRTGYVGMKVKF